MVQLWTERPFAAALCRGGGTIRAATLIVAFSTAGCVEPTNLAYSGNASLQISGQPSAEFTEDTVRIVSCPHHDPPSVVLIGSNCRLVWSDDAYRADPTKPVCVLTFGKRQHHLHVKKARVGWGWTAEVLLGGLDDDSGAYVVYQLSGEQDRLVEVPIREGDNQPAVCPQSTPDLPPGQADDDVARR
jgi:hypothetical protein